MKNINIANNTIKGFKLLDICVFRIKRYYLVTKFKNFYFSSELNKKNTIENKISVNFISISNIPIIINMEKTNIEKTDCNDEIFKINYSEINKLCNKSQDEVVITEDIKLTDVEKKLFEFLKKILDENKIKTVCRVAGGWVRDKLINKNSDDIDICLDDMSGEEFAQFLKFELDKLDMESSKVATIKVNPDKSKHLATSTMTIFGQHIDFVNLRTEKYTEKSRIPEIEIGTPKEDALRRDITINSMFYNIQTGKIEDFLENGFSDLKSKVIRTPISSLYTFRDDPLRILRCVRFATRFEFNISQDIINSSKQEEIKSALREKISNERNRNELKKIFAGKHPFLAINLLYEMNVLEDILKINFFKINEPVSFEELNEITKKVVIISFISDLIIKGNINNSRTMIFDLLGQKSENLDELISSYFLVILAFPFNKFTVKLKKEIVNLSNLILKEALKSTNEEYNLITNMVRNYDEFKKLLNSTSRLEIGLTLRKITYENLFAYILFSIADDYSNYIYKSFHFDSCLKNFDWEKLNLILLKHKDLLSLIVKENLLHSDSLKSLIDGNEIMTIFKIGGPKIGLINQRCIDYQLINPYITKDELIEKINEDISKNEFDIKSKKK